MKRCLAHIILVLFAFQSKAQTVYIQDAGFRQCLNDHYPFLTTMDGDSLNIPNANSYAGLLVCQNYSIVNTQGLEHFQSVLEIDLSNNDLDSIPQLSSISSLNKISVFSNHISQLPDLDHMSNLNTLYIDNNNLTQLPALIETNILSLHTAQNDLTSIDNLGAFINLRTLYAWENQLSSLPTDLSALDSVRIFHIGFNELTSLPDLSSMTKLEKLYIEENNLTVFPSVASFDSLITIYAYGNNFETIPDFSGLPKLEKAFIYDNELTFEDIAPLTAHPDFENVFSYGSQEKVGTEVTYNVIENNPLEIATDVDISISGLTYELIHDTSVLQSNTGGLFTIDNLQQEDAGDYFIRITSIGPTMTDLVLETHPYHINVMPCCKDISFSPNGDGVEDELFISQEGLATIYNSSGQPIKELQIPANWDGTDNNGRPVSVGFYVIQIEGSSSIRVTVLD